jgi:hypothetical protein
VPSLISGTAAERIRVPGEASMFGEVHACRFANRCFRSLDVCRQQRPLLEAVPGQPEHLVACFNPARLNDLTPSPSPARERGGSGWDGGEGP